MRGRFGLEQPPKKIIATLEDAGIQIRNKLKDEKLPKLNIPPSVNIVTVINKDDDNVLDATKWGIKFSDKLPLIFNSRIETIREKPFWLRLFSKNRALVPTDRFYEWKRIGPKGKKTRNLP